MTPSASQIRTLTFSLPTGVATFVNAYDNATAAQAAIAGGGTPPPGKSADGTALVDRLNNPITAVVQNFGVVDANNNPTNFTFAVVPQGATPNPSSDNTPTSMKITSVNMSQVAEALADFWQAEAQTPGSGVEAANNGGANVTDTQNQNWPVTFVADPS